MNNFGQYFAKRKNLYTQSAKGRFRNIKSRLNLVFLSIYLFSPLIRFERAGTTPDQAILIDMTKGKLYFFFLEIWPQEVYYLAGILIFAAIFLFFITSLFGRVWCGYACFQTVWCDIFSLIEKFFQGDRNARILLDRKKNSINKFFRKAATHLCWLIAGVITGLAFVSYFNDSLVLIGSLKNLALTYSQLGWIFGIAFATYIMAGFAREQVCIYMCPYAKFQSAMFDKETLIITYDEKRGEPRGKLTKDEKDVNNGDCIDCKQCVVVCPQGIDIRDGLQIECIACGLCIDACDGVMEKINLPKGLIRYDTMNNITNVDLSKNTKFKFLRPRTFYYLVIIVAISSFMIYSLTFKSVTEISLIADRNPMFVKLSNGDIRNGYSLKITNKTAEKVSFSLKVSLPENALVEIKSMLDGINLNNLPVDLGSTSNFKIYITLPREFLDRLTLRREKEAKVYLMIHNNKTGEEQKIETGFAH